MFWLYRALSFLLSPLLLWRLHRSELDRNSRKRGGLQRRGYVEAAGNRPVWIHAASVGEVNAVSPLIDVLLKRHPDVALLVSTFTVSGADQLQRRFEDRVAHRYLPVDRPGACRRWLTTINPRIGLVVETEIWPELFYQAKRRQLPLFLINARLSERSLKRTRYFRRLFARALSAVNKALCQSQTDADRLIELGLEHDRAQVVGNIKFDAPLPNGLLATSQRLREQWGQRRIWVAGSTRPGEESILIDTHRMLLEHYPEALLIIAPRHPERTNEVVKLIDSSRLNYQRIGEAVHADTQVVLVDQLGVLQACYAAGSIAFVGGSLVDIGGHNLLEPAALGKPVVSGPHLHNQIEMAQALDHAAAIMKVNDAQSLYAAINELWARPELALKQGRAALGVVEQGRGSLAATLKVIRPYLR